jgi:U4/U6.U5 tri-snRNP-associated protein 3
MNRRELDSRERRPAKRSRSPDEHDRSPREDKRRRPPEREREHSPRATRQSSRLNNGRDDRRPREDEERRERDDKRERDRRERDSRSRGRRGRSPPVSWRSFSSNRQDEQSRYEREKRPVNSSKADGEKPRSERKHPPLPPSTEPPSEPGQKKAITASALLEDLDESESESLAKVLGFSRFSTTKGKKHVDYGGVQLIKSREYRQYMNRPGGFNKPIDQA